MKGKHKILLNLFCLYIIYIKKSNSMLHLKIIKKIHIKMLKLVNNKMYWYKNKRIRKMIILYFLTITLLTKLLFFDKLLHFRMK